MHTCVALSFKYHGTKVDYNLNNYWVYTVYAYVNTNYSMPLWFLLSFVLLAREIKKIILVRFSALSITKKKPVFYI